MKNKLGKKKLQELYCIEKKTTKEIGELFNVSDTTIRNLMREYKIPRRDTRFKLGHWSWMKGRKHTEETRKKMSVAHESKRVSKELLRHLYWDEQMSQRKIARKLEVSRSAIEKWMQQYGIPTRRLSQALKLAKPASWLKGRKLQEETKRKIGRGVSEAMTDEVRQKIANASRQRWNTDVLKKLRKARQKRPTNPEKRLISIIKRQEMPFRYVGDGQVIIAGLNPDFIHKTKKKVIEIFGRVFHDPDKSFREVIPYNQTVEGRKAFFSKFGYDTLIFWDDEIEDEERVVDRIKAFIGD